MLEGRSVAAPDAPVERMGITAAQALTSSRLSASHRPYFELKTKYYLQLEVRVAFGFEVGGLAMAVFWAPPSVVGLQTAPRPPGRGTRT